jgi:hypothetical protein
VEVSDILYYVDASVSSKIFSRPMQGTEEIFYCSARISLYIYPIRGIARQQAIDLPTTLPLVKNKLRRFHRTGSFGRSKSGVVWLY